ncbi:DUF4145 domain-containing protein [Diaphorobacter ruginosibacter]|uniref:DUF4145 domain-containing protein n=1 Tax=Diaphorobacter ruginosibacter TaxID=1715720 RepID=A0A7G9RK53_9BURK|nr:DUF4145 domain-containing protein [Diaphorobacter ruginosibacter]QNN55978.1 DUF4145 domain-containing protein [Diaphorobacter ruginosibacter]
MTQLIHNCPRCGAKQITFDALNVANINTKALTTTVGEVFSICRHCRKSTVFICASLHPMDVKTFRNLFGEGIARTANDAVSVRGFVSPRDLSASSEPPEHVPDDIAKIFKEGAVCESLRCFNAAGTMFRLCLDMATSNILPAQDVDGLNSKIRRSLGLRVNWLLKTNRLDPVLEELSLCIREDGNDGAHQGLLSEIDAADIRDFTYELLQRMYTHPERLKLAAVRRDARRQSV